MNSRVKKCAPYIICDFVKVNQYQKLTLTSNSATTKWPYAQALCNGTNQLKNRLMKNKKLSRFYLFPMFGCTRLEKKWILHGYQLFTSSVKQFEN